MHKWIFKTYSKVSIALFALFLIQLSACQEAPPLKLTSRQWEQLDTLYSQEVKGLATQLDSLCDEYYANNLDATVDSLLKIRRLQEQSLRQKYQK
ncbi:MAG: hypothetical protein Sapg2KO_47980 [Saprospiraceae bacterium]